MNEPTTGDEQSQLLDKFRDESALTWAETAARIGISETYLHRVRSGKQKFSRKVMNRLRDMVNSPKPAQVSERAESDYLSRTTQEHILWLEDQLGYARTKEERLLKIIEALSGASDGMGHKASTADPPAVPACGARYGNPVKKERAEA